jgi:hypothetical protein
MAKHNKFQFGRKSKLFRFFDWFDIYAMTLNKWADSDLEIERVSFEKSNGDPMPFRVQISYYSELIKSRIYGYGESLRELHAYEKAICELIEREALFTKGEEYGLFSTNGLACHRWERLAKNSAKIELLERDAFLRHWLTMTPLTIVDDWEDDLILKFKGSVESFGHKLVLAETSLGYIKTSIAVVINPLTNGFLIGSSATSSKQERMRKAVGEAYLSLFNRQGDNIDWKVPNFDNHANFWYYRRSMPQWFLGKENNVTFVTKKLPKPSIHFHTLVSEPVSVVAAKSEELFELWLGDPEKDVLEKIERQYGLRANTEPHPFP